MSQSRSIEARTVNDSWFARRTTTEASGCMEWTKATDKRNGYGKITRVELDGTRRQTTAHRYVWEQLNNGGEPLPSNVVVRHSCDNPPCVNPDHLSVGSQADNLADMDARRRRPAGEASHLARLTAEQVDAIRRRHIPRGPGTRGNSRLLAEEFGIHPDTVTEIVRGARWGANHYSAAGEVVDWGAATCAADGCTRRRTAKRLDDPRASDRCMRCRKRGRREVVAEV